MCPIPYNQKNMSMCGSFSPNLLLSKSSMEILKKNKKKYV